MAYRNRYSGDPKWITARFPSACAGCDKPVRKGDEAFFYSATKSVYGCKCGCGATRAADFESAAFDEAVYASQ